MTTRTAVGTALVAFALTSLVTSPALAQQTSGSTPPSSTTSNTALSTQTGDTGFWVVPTADVLPNRKWSVSFYRTEQADGQGFSDISNFPANFGFGLGNRAELFASWTLVTRIDRDAQPLFFTTPPQASPTGNGGGLLVNYPLVRRSWIGNARGDLRLGGKVSLLSEANHAPIGAALRLIVKVPVGDTTLGSSTGKPDFEVHGVVSKNTPVAELSAYGGPIFRGNPTGYQLTNGLEWGVGVGLPERYSFGLHVTAELYGERYFNTTITGPPGLIGVDGSVIPTSTNVFSPVFADLGLTWQAPNGFFIGVSASRNMHMSSRTDALDVLPNTFADSPRDKSGYEVRLGFYPSVHHEHAAVAPPPAPPGPNRGGPPINPPPPTPGAGGTGAPPVAATAPANRPPTVRAMCDPCTVEIGKTSTVSADAQDPDGDPLTYRWSAPSGTFGNGTSRQTPWTAPMQVGPVVTTVTVDDGHGHQASDGVTIQVIRPIAREITFEDVYFDFDRSSLRAEAQKILDDAVAAMQANPTLQITIEGYTCNIGTPEYNLALGERRARAVRDYLVSKGVSTTRLRTVSYGEERPKFDNSREETRRLNRRAVLVVRLSGGD
jgi:peptidoglycan-associated lipoprotein